MAASPEAFPNLSGWSAGTDAVLDALPEAIVIIDVETLRYVAANKAACRFIGCSRDEVLATDAGSLLQERHGWSRDVLRRRYRALVDIHPEPVVQRGPFRSASGVAFETEFHRQAVLLEGRWVIVVRAVPLKAHPGSANVEDSAFRNMLALSRDAVALVDGQGLRVTQVNRGATELLGYGQAELVQRGLSAWGSSPDEFRSVLAALIETAPQAATVETELQHKDGRCVPVQLTRQAVDDDGRWVVVLSARDISGRKRAEAELHAHVAELARSNRELERFAYIASHDLLEPLRTVASYTQLMQRRYASQLDDDAREFMDFIVTGAKRMKEVLDDLLTYSRVGRLARQPQHVDLNAVMRDVLDNLHTLVVEADATIERAELPVVPGDRMELTQLLQNLVANALKFRVAGRRTELRVQCEDGADAWTFGISDNGIGIAPQYFDRIFTMFQRLHPREDYAGTGIGLAICRKVVERHGGRIWVESEPGAGATFHFTLPRNPPA